MNLTPQERQRRSVLARQMHAEGKFGGPQQGKQGGIAKARKSSELAQEIVEKHRTKIERALLDGLASPRVSERLKAAELALKYGLASERLDAVEGKVHVERLDRAELLERLSVALTSGPTAGIIRARLEATNAEAIEDAEVVA